MNLLEAIQNCGDNWFRPKHWHGHGNAFSIGIDGFIRKQLSLGGEIDCFMLPILVAMADFEIVTPEQVISERK